MSETATVPWDRLRDFSVKVLESAGMGTGNAGLTADVLLRSNLRGVDSHGVRLLPVYVDLIAQGEFDPDPDEKVVSDTGATVLMDAGGGLGQPVSCRGMTAAVARSRAFGIGIAVVRNSHHFAAAAPYALQAAEADTIGIALSNTSLSMATHGGTRRVLGNNPMAMAAPAAKEAPFCFDMATSIAAWGKVISHVLAGEPIPDGWCLDKSGKPTTDGRTALDGGVILPAAGPKGAGLAFFIDIMTGVLGGGLFGFGIGDTGKCLESSSHCFIAVNVEAFMPVSRFKQRLDQAIREIVGSQDLIRVPGQRAHRTEMARRRNGIPLPAEVRSRLEELGERVGRPFEA